MFKFVWILFVVNIIFIIIVILARTFFFGPMKKNSLEKEYDAVWLQIYTAHSNSLFCPSLF